MLKIHNPKIKPKNENAPMQEEEQEQMEFPMELFQLMQARDNLELEDRGIIFINNIFMFTIYLWEMLLIKRCKK